MTIRLAYRPEEVAQLLGLGRTTVFELLRSGELESVKAGRARLVPADAIDRYLSKGLGRRSHRELREAQRSA